MITNKNIGSILVESDTSRVTSLLGRGLILEHAVKVSKHFHRIYPFNRARAVAKEARVSPAV